MSIPSRNYDPAHMVENPEAYDFCSAHPGYHLDARPQGLKPTSYMTLVGTAEAVP